MVPYGHRQAVSQLSLVSCNVKGTGSEGFLSQVVTESETCVHNCESKSKWISTEWREHDFVWKKEFGSALSAGKVSGCEPLE